MLKAAQHPIKKRIKLYGFDISIENPKGSTRSWKDPYSGESGSTKMRWDYGYIRRTEGTDGDHVDVYVGPMPESTKVFVINQMKKPDFKEFDEQKVMLAFPNAVAAKSAYLKQYNDPRFFGSMKEMSIEDFRKKVLDKDFHGKKVAAQGVSKADYKKPGPTGLGYASYGHYNKNVSDAIDHGVGTGAKAVQVRHPNGTSDIYALHRSAGGVRPVLMKLGAHADDRFEERSILPPERLKKIRGLLQEASRSGTGHLPERFAVPLEDSSKAIVERKGKTLILKTVLSPSMNTNVPAILQNELVQKPRAEEPMPFKSKRQQRAAFGGHIPGISKEKAREWAHETPDLKDLPDRAPSEKGKPTLRSKESGFMPSSALMGAGVGALVGGVGGAATAGEGHRLSGALRGGVVGGALGGTGGAVLGHNANQLVGGADAAKALISRRAGSNTLRGAMVEQAAKDPRAFLTAGRTAQGALLAVPVAAGVGGMVAGKTAGKTLRGHVAEFAGRMIDHIDQHKKDVSKIMHDLAAQPLPKVPPPRSPSIDPEKALALGAVGTAGATGYLIGKHRKESQLAHAHDKGTGLEEREILEGLQVEKEHTKNPATARQIAIDHIRERPDYYEKLKKMEKSPMDPKVQARLKEASVDALYFAELNLEKLAAGEEFVDTGRVLGEKKKGVGDEIPPQTEFAQAIQGDSIKAAGTLPGLGAVAPPAASAAPPVSAARTLPGVGGVLPAASPVAAAAAPRVSPMAAAAAHPGPAGIVARTREAIQKSPRAAGAAVGGLALGAAGGLLYHLHQKRKQDQMAEAVAEGVRRAKRSSDDRVNRIADRLDDLGIGILAAPYAASGASKLVGKIKKPWAQAASKGLGNAAHAMHASDARELTGLALVAPGVTHRLAKGIDRVLPGEKKAAIATYEQLRQAGSEPARQISEEISKERRAAIEKVAAQLYPDWEYFTNEKQADVVANLGRLAQKGKGLVQQVVGGHGVPGVQGPGTALMSHLREGAQSFGRDLAAIPGNIAEAVKDVGGRAASKLERRFAAGQRLERIRAGGHTPGLIGGGGTAPIPVTRAHPAVPAPAASRAATERGVASLPAPAPSAATHEMAAARSAAATPIPAAAPAASSADLKTVRQARPEAAPRSAEAKTVAAAKGKGGGPYREPAAAPAAAPAAVAAEAAAPAAAAQKGRGPVTQAWADSPVAGQAPPKKSLARRLLPALAVGGTAVGLGGTALAAGHGLSALQRAQEETTGAPPLAAPTFVGPGRVV